MAVVRDVVIRFIADAEGLKRGSSEFEVLNKKVRDFQLANQQSTNVLNGISKAIRQLQAAIGSTFDTEKIKSYTTQLQNLQRTYDAQVKKQADAINSQIILSREYKKAGDIVSDTTKKTIIAAQDSTKSFSNMNAGLINLANQIGITFSIATIIQFGKTALSEFRKTEEEARKLSFAVSEIANGTDGDLDILIKQSKDLQVQGIFSSGQIQTAQTALLTIGLTVEQVEKLVPAIADAAALNGEFDGTLQKVIMGINGSNRGLNSMGVYLSDVKDKGERVNKITEIMSENFGGGLADALKTSAGAAANLNNRWNDMMAQMGELISDGIGVMKASITDAIDSLDDFGKSADGTVTSINTLIKSFIEYSTLGIVSFEGSTTNAVKAQKEFKKSLDDTIASMGGDAQARLLALSTSWQQLEDDVWQGQVGLDDYKARFTTILDELVKLTNDTQKKIVPIVPDCDDECQQKKKDDANKLFKETQELRKSQLRQLQELEASMFEEGIEREKALRKVRFDQELEDVVGHTELSNQLRIALREKYFQDLEDIEQKYKEKDAEGREKEAEEEEKRREKEKQKELEDEEKHQKALNEILESWKQKALDFDVAASELRLEMQQMELDAFSDGFDLMKGFFKDNAKMQQALLVFEKLASIVEIIVRLQLEKAANRAAFAAVPAFIPPGIPNPAKVGAGILLSAQQAKANLSAGLSIAAIAAQAIPEIAGFAKGVIDLKRDKHPIGKDTIPAMLDEGESVMTSDETKRHKGLFQAIRDNEFEKFIQEKFVLPQLNMQLGYRWLGSQTPQSFKLDERKLAKAMPKSVSVNNIDDLAKAITKEERKNRMFNRRGVS